MPSRDDYCPVAKTAEMLDRWSVLLVREMLRGVSRFNDLERSVPGISRSVLAQRLRHLERTQIIVREIGANARASEYRLTDAGRELVGVIVALGDWGTRWLLPEDRPVVTDPDGLMRWVQRRVMLDALPDRRVVIRFELRVSRSRRRFWLVLRPGEVSLCPEHPGFEEDVWISARAEAFYRVMVGQRTLVQAEEDGSVRVEGPPELLRALPSWFLIS